jgi:hypothetical protein
METSQLVLMLNLKHEFPSEWHLFSTTGQPFRATLKKQHFPYLFQGRRIILRRVRLYTIDANELGPPVSVLDAAGLQAATDTLGDSGELELSLAPNAVLVPGREVPIFMLVEYAAAEVV